MTSKRDRVLEVLDDSGPQETIPAAFFLHFGAEHHGGQAAVDKHLEFYRFTGMDFVKIQYERTFPKTDAIQRPSDWERVPRYGLEFYAPQLEAVRGLVEAAKAEALVVQTLYSPFMCAGHMAGKDLLARHMAEDPGAVRKGMEIIADSLMEFVRECIRLGVDGFYHSTQGGESGRLADRRLFDECVRPYDLALMEEANRRCPFNILHVCDYHAGYDDLTPFKDYPGHVVNCSPHVGGRTLTGEEITSLFGRPFMGGMGRKGPLSTGTEAEVRAEARAALERAPARFLLAADCTVLGGTPWENLRAAIDTAHTWAAG